jgi:Flp pilus assembly protein TadB
MSFVAVAIGTLAATTIYGADRQRRATNRQTDAIKAQQEDDARKAAEAETSAQVAANARLADTKRRRRASALELGNPAGTADTLGGTAGSSVLSSAGPSAAAGRSATTAAGASAAYSGGTALGAGAALSRSTGGGGRRGGSGSTMAAL